MVPRQPVDDEVVYRDVFEGVDLTYTVEAGGVKEALILEAAPNAGEASWQWRINAPLLDLTVEESGVVNFTDQYGRVKFHIPAPLMWDSSGIDGVREAAEKNLTTRVWRDGAQWVLELSADEVWLADSERVYPVTVDPTANAGVAAYYAYKSDGATRNDGVHVGNARSPGNVYWRTIVAYGFSALAGKQALDAAIGLGYADGYTGSAIGNLYQSTCYGFSCAGSYLGTYTIGSGTTVSQHVNLRTKVAERLNGGSTALSIMFTGTEGGTYTYKMLDQVLSISYKNKPAVVMASPAVGESTTVTPTLVATGTPAPGYGLYYKFRVLANAGVVVEEAPWQSSNTYQPAAALAASTTYKWQVQVKDTANGYLGASTVSAWTAVRTFITDLPPVHPARTSALPIDEATVSTVTPTLTVTIPSTGAAGEYQFRVTTGADGKSGVVVTSGWFAVTAGQVLSWPVPAGTLTNGGSYSWGVMAKNTTTTLTSEPNWVNKLRVDMRLGASGPSPFDSAGPVTVNLANGNVAMSFASPTVSTLGGAMGMAFSYNSQESGRGLNAEYFNALNTTQTVTSSFTFSGRTPLLQRIDAAPSAVWGIGSPAPIIPSNYFLARWTGFITPDATGTYTFAVKSDDGAQAFIRSSTSPTSAEVKVVDQWTVGPKTSLVWGTGIAMTAGQSRAIRFEMFESTGTANVELWVTKPGEQPMPVPSTWFTTTPPVLPFGWGSSTPITGSPAMFTSARVSEASVTITDVSGGIHTYTKTSEGGYEPPFGDYSVLSLTGSKLVVLTTEDGTVYQFNEAGKVEVVTSAADVTKPAAPSVKYNTNGTADRIVDPVAGTPERAVKFFYDTGSASTDCPVSDPALYSADTRFLCKVVYPDGSATRLLYNLNGQLARITDPGNVNTDFGYDGFGRITTIRDASANEWLAVNNIPIADHDVPVTEIGYDDFGRAVSVTLPPSSMSNQTDRPSKTYTYSGTPLLPGSVPWTTTVNVAGLDLGTAAFARKVTYDQAWRMVSNESALGLIGSQEWSAAKDQLLSATDPWGYKTTTIYNSLDRPTDVYGPAPESCFDPVTRLPGTCSVVPAHTTTNYDRESSGQPLVGLQAAFYANKDLSGKPAAFRLGIPLESTGVIDKTWGTASPIAGVIPVDGWSVRFTGLITFPQAGDYVFQTNADDSTRLWIDDKAVIDYWRTGALALSPDAVIVRIAPGEQNIPRRIRLEYADISSTADLELRWFLPGTTETTQTVSTVVPGANLSPDYGLANLTTTEDSAPAGSELADPSDIVTLLGYDDKPWLGAVTSTRLDPYGQNLETLTTFEAESQLDGWMRRLTRVMPAAHVGPTTVATQTTQSDYYDATEGPVANGCTASNVAGSQYGLLKSITQPTPATGAPVVTEFVYDSWGRAVGSKRSGDTGWTCTTFDARNRPVSTSFPAVAGQGGAPARTAQYTYGVTATGFVATVSDAAVAGSPNGSTITTTTDLLGRTTTYTDVWGTVTTPTYEPKTGRVLQVTTVTAAGDAASQKFTYDVEGKVLLVELGDATLPNPGWEPIADPTYAANQWLDTIKYLNDTWLRSTSRNDTGAIKALTWEFPELTTTGQPVAHEAVTIVSTDFETGLDSWVASTGATTGSISHSGASVAIIDQTGSSPATLTRTITGLTPGRDYTIQAWVATTDPAPAVVSASVEVAGIGASQAVTLTPAVGTALTWVRVSHTFTATATSHTMAVAASAPTHDASVAIDDITVTKDAWTEPGATTVVQPLGTVKDAVVRSQSGRIIQNELTDGPITDVWTYTFDTAGRLTHAVQDDGNATTPAEHELTYEFAASGGCGVNTRAGMNGNRTRFTDVKDGATVTDSTYCYDWADRLTSSISTIAGTNPVLGGNLVTVGPLPSIVYDSHGNTTRLADQLLSYDSADRHVSTTLDDGSTIVYVRDSTGRVVARTSNPTGTDPTVTVHYTFAASGLFAVLDETGELVERNVSLPGGVQVTIPVSGEPVWSYPNLHGDVILTGACQVVCVSGLRLDHF